jgi:hypothetical protein
MREARQDRTITVTLSGEADNPRLDDFVEEMQKLKTALRETERLVSGREPTLYFRIRRLQKSSPVQVTLEAVSEAEDDRGEPKFANYVVRSFTTNLRVIDRRKRLPQKIEYPVIQAYKELTAPAEQHRLEVEIAAGNRKVVLNRQFRETLDRLIGSDEYGYGALSGRIEAMNLHGKRRFWLYPVVGPSRVSGTFPPMQRGRFTAAFDKYVTVYGRLRYKTWDKYPYAIAADDIRTHDQEGPRLIDLKGVAPGATGEVGSREFIDRLHDEW